MMTIETIWQSFWDRIGASAGSYDSCGRGARPMPHAWDKVNEIPYGVMLEAIEKFVYQRRYFIPTGIGFNLLQNILQEMKANTSQSQKSYFLPPYQRK